MTLKQAWDKTIKKWEYIFETDDRSYVNDITSCGLCDLFYWNNCRHCPIKEMTGRLYCLGTNINKGMTRKSVKDTYMFLLLVREATLND